eukprot:412070_1
MIQKKQLILELISRMHVYFIHSYHMDRLTLEERNIIENVVAVADENEIDTELEDKRIELIITIMQQKQKILNVSKNTNKYIEANRQINANNVNFSKIYAILRSHDVGIKLHSIQAAFAKYQTDRNRLISDVIEAYFNKINECLPLSNKIQTLHLPDNDIERHKIYQYILYEYIHKSNLNTDNFIKMVRNMYHVLNC